PSPNMPTLETAALYPGLCLVEATTLSEGRGTTRPFKLVGAPGLDAPALTGALRGLPGVAVRPAWFRPQFGKHAGEVCSGVELAVTDRAHLRPVELGVRLLDAVYRLDPGRFSWRAEAYEFVEEIPAIDLLTGDERARKAIETGTGLDELLVSWQEEVSRFEEILRDILLSS
ncbi:MAG: DUF1343 domain-containing protein, partial [Acidobacteria bacterium]|nr:DUF1343 domain-containing protein [Acidobacteriota bacterium]